MTLTLDTKQDRAAGCRAWWCPLRHSGAHRAYIVDQLTWSHPLLFLSSTVLFSYHHQYITRNTPQPLTLTTSGASQQCKIIKFYDNYTVSQKNKTPKSCPSPIGGEPSLPFLYPPLPFPSTSLHLPFFHLPLEVGPLNTAGGLGERCKLP